MYFFGGKCLQGPGPSVSYTGGFQNSAHMIKTHLVKILVLPALKLLKTEHSALLKFVLKLSAL